MQGSRRSPGLLRREPLQLGAACSRRSLLAMLGAAVTPSWAAGESPRGRVLPSVAVKYLDPATEFVVVRVTDPRYNALLPSGGTRPLTPRAMLYASDLTGRWEAFRMDLRTHESRQLTDAAALDPHSLSFQGGDKGFWHFDAGRLIETNFANNKTREIYRVPDEFEKMPGVAYSDDGRTAAFVEQSTGEKIRVEENGDQKIGTENGDPDKRAAEKSGGYRLRVLDLIRGAAQTLSEEADEITEPLIRPKHAAVLYRAGSSRWLMDFSGSPEQRPAKQRLTLADGEALECQWASDGHALLYLNRPPDPRKLAEMREFVPETGADTWLAGTTQFVRFNANADASVFAGASGSKASPYVLLLARAVKREFTLAEHKASDPRMVSPMFTPNSQALLFQSDRHGKPAIYWMALEKFVSETEGS